MLVVVKNPAFASTGSMLIELLTDTINFAVKLVAQTAEAFFVQDHYFLTLNIFFLSKKN